MPELPEVETICRHLAPHVEGRVLERLEVLDPRWCDPAPPSALDDATRGRRIERLWRRGKYLVLELEDDVHLVMHLRMTGNLLLARDAPPARSVVQRGRRRGIAPARIQDVEPLEDAALDVRRQVAADGLDLG